MPDCEVLDTKIASALNRIIHNTQVRRKVSLEEQKAQKEDRFLRGRQIAYLIYEYFDGQGNGVSKAGQKQAVAGSRGSRTCMCANTSALRVAHAGEER